MYHFNYVRDQWLILSLGGGLLMVLLITLSYLALWQPRPPAERGGPRRAYEATRQPLPWVLIVIYLVIGVYYFISPFWWND